MGTPCPHKKVHPRINKPAFYFYYNVKNLLYLYTMSDNKNPKEASNIFHSIMKASVKSNKVKCPVCGVDAKPITPKSDTYKCDNGHEFSK